MFEINEYIQKNKTWVLIKGVLLAILGLVGIALPGLSTLSTGLFIGWFLLIGGVIQAYRSFSLKNRSYFWAELLTAILYGIFGLLLLINPLAGVVSLTIILTFFLFLEGIAKIFYGFQLKPLKNYGWLIVNGIMALIMVGIILAGWPTTAFWVIGLLVSINILFFGISLIALALSHPNLPVEKQ